MTPATDACEEVGLPIANVSWLYRLNTAHVHTARSNVSTANQPLKPGRSEGVMLVVEGHAAPKTFAKQALNLAMSVVARVLNWPNSRSPWYSQSFG